MKADKAAYRPAARVVLVAACILMLPLVAMQVTDEVRWDLADFVVAGALLVGTGLAYELAARKAGNVAYRAALGVALAAALLLVWLSLGRWHHRSDGDPANAMYFGVLAVGIIGAIIARFRPHGMARALFATALAQALVAVIALILGLGAPVQRAAGGLGLERVLRRAVRRIGLAVPAGARATPAERGSSVQARSRCTLTLSLYGSVPGKGPA